MTTSDDRALALLQALLRISRDSAEGYVRAERDLPDREIAAELDRYRLQRQKIVDEVEKRIRELRGDPDGSRTVAGAAHRAWIDARSVTAANPTEAMLTEIERGEDVAVDAFRQALKESDIDAATRRLLEHQYELVQAAHDRVKQLRDRATLARTL